MTHSPAAPAAECAELEARLRQLLSRPAVRRALEPDARDAACDYVLCLRKAGLSPEAMLVRLKPIVKECINAAHRSHDTAEVLAAELIRVCIEEYYR
jgi:hypothetical protein